MQKLEVGKDYIDSNFIVIDRTGDTANRGFYGNNFEHDLFCSSPDEWREATKEEVIEAFEKHLPHRFGEDWRTMKIKEIHPNSDGDINNGLWNVAISKEYDGWNVYNKNGLLYCDGIWVERLEEKEEEPKIHIKEAIKENTVIHCETEEEAERVLGMAHTLGYKWHNGKNYENNTEWGDCERTTCYYFFEGGYGDYDYFKKNDYTIIPSTQIADLEEEKSAKKRYEVIKTTFSDFKQLSLGDNKTNKIVAHFVQQDEETLTLAEKIVDILNLMEK